MPTQIALLRGINVGRAKRIAMADLRKLVEGLGYANVRTLLNSGNVVYSSSRAASGNTAKRLEAALTKELGVTARITVLTSEELGLIVSENPLLKVATDHSRLLVAVFRDPADQAKLSAHKKQDWGKEALALGKRVAYMWCPDGVLDSQLGASVARALGDAVTCRNWATVLKLHALAATSN